jgi:tetratricopeptide (TPR) repeat protein
MDTQIEHLISQAIERFQIGSPKQAEEILTRILSTQANNLPALEILGLIKASQGNHLEAAKLLKKAIKLNPQNPATQYNLAKALSESKDYVGSLIHHEKALQLAPNNPDGWLNYGQTLAVLKRYEQALTAFNNALSINPQYAEAWHNKGLGCAQLAQHEEAVGCINRAIELQPNNPKIWLDMSTSLGALKRYQDALHCCEQALALQPNYPEAWLNKGSAFSELKQFNEAIECYNSALALKNDFVDAWYSKGVALDKLDQQQEALDCYNKALELDPSYAKAWLNKGSVLNYMAQYQDAIACFDSAIQLQPDYADAWANKGVALYELLQLDEAIQCCNKAIEFDPEHVDAHWNKSFSQLMLGNLDQGWINYEYRWRRKGADQNPHPHIPALTSLSTLAGKKILVWSEQGFGDTLQFARYIPKLIDLGAQVTFEVQEPLVQLFQNQYPCILATKGSPIEAADFQIPLVSLPLLFKTNSESIPTNIPYIKVAPEKIQEWGNRLPLSKEKLNIGIACSGNIDFDLKHGNRRPIPLAHFSELAQQHNLFLIQKDIRDSDQVTLQTLNTIHPLGHLINNFEDTAAIIENMDLIISIDTSLVHLAGALGKKALVLLSWSPDWRWLSEGATNPWYPTATLFRQPSAGDWESVMGKVGDAAHDIA